MCKRKPGPRCYNHAKPKYDKACQKVEDAEAAYVQAVTDAGGDVNEVPAKYDEDRKSAYAERYEAMRQYYSTPRARQEMKDKVLPESEKAQADAEAAYNRAVEAAGGDEKAVPRHIKAQRTAARATNTRNRNLLRHGEQRWSQANADLKTNETRQAAMDSGDYDRAQYDNVDLSRASSWDTLNAKPKWSADRKTVRREMRIETPTQERIKAVSDTQIKGNKTQGYWVETTTYSQNGYLRTPDSSGSSLPAYQDPKTKKRTKDKEFTYSKTAQHTQGSRLFTSYAEAKDEATKMATDNRVPAQLAHGARNRAIGAHAASQGITTQQQYDEHMAAQRAQRTAAREERVTAAGARAQQPATAAAPAAAPAKSSVAPDGERARFEAQLKDAQQRGDTSAEAAWSEALRQHDRNEAQGYNPEDRQAQRAANTAKRRQTSNA